MKTEIASKMSRISRALLAAALALAGAISAKAQNFFDSSVSGIDLGNASGGTTGGHLHWAIFTLGGNVTITDPNPYTPTATHGPNDPAYYASAGSADVYGNVGISGSGILSMSKSYIDGFVTEATAGSTLAGNPIGNPYFLGGNININSAYMASGAASAIAASNTAAGQGNFVGVGNTAATTAVFTSGTKSEVNLGITGGAQAGATYVLHLTDLILSGASTILTLHGTNTTNYVLNIDRYMTLGGGAKITLAGGLTESNVLYNVRNNDNFGVNPTQGTPYDVTLSGGSEVHGIILATTRAVKETGDSKVYGEVIAKSVSLSGASNVINPLVSP